ncbi:MAG: SPOR domain-containing protein [Draconibacterium sp.]|nr:SPOR domain-containing protein [Draconibacterium sp.]
MNLGKYIHELLLENETVIIPGFGAFVSNYKPAEINEDTNELKPPSKEISFSSQIRNNDGLLVGSVALGEGVSHFDALKKIEKERENIIYQLDKSEKVILEDTGELFVNEKHEIQFAPSVDDNLLLDSFGLESVLLEDPIEKEELLIAENVEVEKEEILKDEKATPPEAVVIPEKEILESEPEPVHYKKHEKEEKKKRGFLWLLLMLIPIIFVGVFLYYQNKTEQKPVVKTTEKPTLIIKEEPILKADSTVIDSTSVFFQDSIQTKKEETTPVEIVVSDSPKFYLVGGSFKEEQNADNYLIELKDKGFEPFKLGKRGNFYIIGIGSYDTEKEAVIAKQKFIAENQGAGVWVMEDKK